MGNKARNATTRAMARAVKLQRKAAEEAGDAMWYRDDEPGWAAAAQELSAKLYRQARNERYAALGLPLEDEPTEEPRRPAPLWDLLPKNARPWQR